MFNRFFVSFFILCLFSFNVSAKRSDNPFAKNESLNIGKDISWSIDKKALLATKTVSDEKGVYYHLHFDNRQLELTISSDATGAVPKVFNQLEIKNVTIDGKQSSVFKWCLKNQQRHNRFLQQGLSVKNDVCTVSGSTGSFTMRLNKDTLKSLQEGSRLSVMLKPFRTPLDLNYDISDFKDMYIALNAKPAPAAVAVTKIPAAKPVKKCWAGPPARYKNIKSVEYSCEDAAAKKDAGAWVINLVNQEKAKEQKLAAEREKQRKLAAERKQKVLAEKAKQEELLAAETAAIAASQMKQAEIGSEITEKMVNVCKKYWDKGEHRCYCQKYIDYAPSSIQASSACK